MYQVFFWAARGRMRPRPGATARPSRGRAAEPRLAGSRGSRHIRVTPPAARPRSLRRQIAFNGNVPTLVRQQAFDPFVTAPSRRLLSACSRARACQGMAWKRRSSRRGWARRPALTALRAAAECDRGSGRRNGHSGRTKKLSSACRRSTRFPLRRYLVISRVRDALLVILTPP